MRVVVTVTVDVVFGSASPALQAAMSNCPSPTAGGETVPLFDANRLVGVRL